ncbi:MAG: hypothetical protein M1818_007913 [Claussenomyces sp. TS43310]|nr:MAG: hypothetical protein M1818_007913 [Claussenomyces sp. TS43310]
MDDEALSGFVAITGASPEVARHFLHMTDGSMEQAIQLFFDSPDLSTTMSAETPSAPPAQASRPHRQAAQMGRTDSAGVVHLDSDDDDDMTDNDYEGNAARNAQKEESNTASNVGGYSDDEAMARRMQEELYAGGDMSGGFDAEGVRAPIARTTETLVGPNADWGPEDMHDAVLQQLRLRQQPRTGRRGVFNQQSSTSSSIWSESNPEARRAGLAQVTGGASEANSKTAKLAELFRPPFELMSRIPWDDARQQGKEEQKWILVNVQDASIFDCQALNRDIWKHEGIKETIKENFIFMQYSKDDPSGSQYIQYYFPERDSEAAYPHIAIVDPRTGEQVKVWSGPPVPKAMDFLMQLHEFLDRYSLNAAVRNPVAKRKPEKSTSLDVGRLSEEEMLELALQNSLANASAGGPKSHDPDDLTKGVDEVGKGKGKAIAEDGMDLDEASSDGRDTEPVGSAPFDLIASDHPHVEPENDPATTTRIQFRHSGGRIIRRFSVADPVQRIYEWLKAEPIEGKVGTPFELKAMGKDLIELLDTTIVDAGLKNATIMVEYLED